MKLSYLKIPFINLLIAGLIGVFLRYFHISPVSGINFKNLLHTHSHVAFLGWVYLALFIGVLFAFFPQEVRNKKTYKIQFWLTQVSVFGMLFSFPVQGYGLYSILFSTMHIFLSWWFIFSVRKDLRKIYSPKDITLPSVRFLNAGFLFLFISAAGPFALGPLMVNGFGGTDYYYMAIYYYLHFQYNGWFLFGLIALFLKFLEAKAPVKTAGKRFFNLMFFSSFLTLALSALFSKPGISVIATGFIGSIIQLFSLIYLKQIISRVKNRLNIPRFLQNIVILVTLCFVTKVIFQVMSVFIDVLQIRTFVIAYLHLVLLGVITLGMFLCLFLTGWLDYSVSTNRHGTSLFILGFVLSEGFLFAQGFIAWFTLPFIDLGPAVFYSSFVMVAGFLVLAVSVLKNQEFITGNIGVMGLGRLINKDKRI